MSSSSQNVALFLGVGFAAGLVLPRVWKFVASKVNRVSSAKSKHPPTITLNPEGIFEYYLNHSLQESSALQRLRTEVVEPHEVAQMSASPDESQFLALLIQLTNSKKVIEVGTFLGYTTLAIAQALPSDGKIVTLDISDDFTKKAKPYWEIGGVANKIDLRLAPGTDSLNNILKSEGENSYDFAFIDADKVNYDAYYEILLKVIKKGGIIAVDNTLWDGKIIAPKQGDESTIAIDKLNKKLFNDKRVQISMLPIADGLTLLRKL